MTLSAQPIDATAGSPAFTAQQSRQAFAAHIANGSARTLGTVSGWCPGRSPSVLTATSTTWTVGQFAALIDPAFTTTQSIYEVANDANLTGSVTAAAAGIRKDILYVTVNDTVVDSSGSRNATVSYLAGDSTTHAIPATPARSFLIATITVPQSGGGSPTIALNPAYQVAAGGIQPVTDSTLYPAVPYVGQEVYDLALLSNVRWDGTRWSGAWTTFTPAWTNLSVGNGTNIGRYLLTSKAMHLRIGILFGSTTAISASVSVALPSGFVASTDIEQNIPLKLVAVGASQIFLGFANLASAGSSLTLWEPSSGTSTSMAQVGSYGQTMGSGSNLIVQGTIQVA